MKILIADDEVIFRQILTAMLTDWGYEVVSVADGAQAWLALNVPDPPRLAVLDWMMPGMDGVQVCQAVRERGEEPYVYILLLTSKTQMDDIVAGFEAGADDYVTKPFDWHELKFRLRAGERILELQRQLIATREELRIQATHDALTRIWNRQTIMEMLDLELVRARRSNTEVTVIMVDIDHFKLVNDSYGHLTGDLVLRETVARMKGQIREYDGIGRYGGEEFLIVLSDCNLIQGAEIAEKLRQAVSSRTVSHAGGDISVTASFGVSASGAGETVEARELIDSADKSLYRAKGAGRNRVVCSVDKLP